MHAIKAKIPALLGKNFVKSHGATVHPDSVIMAMRDGTKIPLMDIPNGHYWVELHDGSKDCEALVNETISMRNENVKAEDTATPEVFPLIVGVSLQVANEYVNAEKKSRS